MISMLPLSDSEKQWQQHFERKLESVVGSSSFNTAFLDPRQLELAEAAIHKKAALSYTVFGGYPGAERNQIHVFPAHHKESLPPVSAIKVSWNDSNTRISHRDLLGAVLALGLKRDQIGDILVIGDGTAVLMIVDSKIEYICSNLLRVGHLPVGCTTVDLDQLPLSAEDYREITGTVASLRVDSVLSLGFGVSRSRVVRLIKGGLVRLNWRSIDSPSMQLKEGDQLSLRNRGRLLITAVEGETRKGRIRLKLKKYS